MKITYTVASRSKQPVEKRINLIGGASVDATLQMSEVDLVPDDPNNSTVRITFLDAKAHEQFAEGKRIVATFEEVDQ